MNKPWIKHCTFRNAKRRLIRMWMMFRLNRDFAGHTSHFVGFDVPKFKWSSPLDPSLRWAHTHFVGFVMTWLTDKAQASLHICMARAFAVGTYIVWNKRKLQRMSRRSGPTGWLCVWRTTDSKTFFMWRIKYGSGNLPRRFSFWRSVSVSGLGRIFYFKWLRFCPGNYEKNGRLYICTQYWATSRENMSSGNFDQVRFKPACSATEAS